MTSAAFHGGNKERARYWVQSHSLCELSPQRDSEGKSVRELEYVQDMDQSAVEKWELEKRIRIAAIGSLPPS